MTITETIILKLLNNAAAAQTASATALSSKRVLHARRYKTLCPESSATGMGQFPICKLKWDLLRTSITACTIDENTFSAPFGIFYVKTDI